MLVLVQLGGSPLFLFMAGSFIQGAMKGIYYSPKERVSIDTPQPDGSVVKTSVFKHLGFYIIISLGDNGSQKGQLRLVL
jgi:hypothetical protein